MNTANLRIITLFFLILCIGLYFYTNEQKKYYDAVAIPIATNMLNDISLWEKPALKKHLSAEAQQTLNDQQLGTLLDHYRQFGQLQSLEPLQFSQLASALALLGEKRINYQTEATFSEGRAHINLTLIPKGEQFKIYNFSINPISH
ncbi:MAG: hypothetical protein WCY88_08835 [Spongiibacteraceae bacterium]